MPRIRRPTAQRRVALLIDSSRSYPRELLLGISRYNQERKRWLVEFTPHGIRDMPPAWFRQWQGDGIIARVHGPRLAEAIRRKGVPVVDLRQSLRREWMPSLYPDMAKVARLVFDHFRDRGFRSYAFVTAPTSSHWAMEA